MHSLSVFSSHTKQSLEKRQQIANELCTKHQKELEMYCYTCHKVNTNGDQDEKNNDNTNSDHDDKSNDNNNGVKVRVCSSVHIVFITVFFLILDNNLLPHL